MIPGGSPPYLVDGRVVLICGLDGCHHLGFLPPPVHQGPVGAASLSDDVFGVRGKRHADKFLRLQVRERQDLSLPQGMEVEDGDRRLFSFVGDSSVSLIGCDGLKMERNV